MKTMIKFVTMMFIVAFASHANAATEINTKDGKISVDGDKVSINTKPAVKPAATKAPTKKKKVVGKKKKKLVKNPGVQYALPEELMTSPQVPIEEAKKNLAELVNPGVDITPLGDSTNSATQVTKTAKKDDKKKFVGVKFNINLFDIFMPNKLTSTARKDHLSVSGVMNNSMPLRTTDTFNGVNTVSDPNVANITAALKAKLGSVFLDYQPMEVKRSRNTFIKGAPVGQVDVFTSNKITIGFYVLEELLKTYDSGLTLDAGYEYSRVDGNLMIGVGKVANEGGGWSSVYRATYHYYYNDRISAFIGWEKENIQLTNRFVSAGLDTTIFEGGPFAGLNIGLF